MKKHVVVIALILSAVNGFAQIIEPVTWTTSVKKISETEYDLVAVAQIEMGYHLYSQTVPDNGPKPTAFTFENHNGMVTLIGNTMEDEGHTEFDPIFGMDIKYFEGMATFTQKVMVDGDITHISATVDYMACDNTKCISPPEEDLIFEIRKGTLATENQAKAISPVGSTSTVADVATTNAKGLWRIFLIAFLSGFAALLTPCVFPMIPMTVSYFTKQSKTKSIGIKNAIIYGVCIVLIYLILGTVVTALFGADALNALATNTWFNLLFFLLLLVFALSFLGAFEIMLPNSWANKVDAKADRGGLTGIFFMAMALAIVSFSCTGPIVGTLLVEAASKGGIAPIVGMLGFSLAIALPFGLFAAFPGWLNSLPKSGGWLNTIKVILGFLELALAFKFLSQADLVLQTHLLERELFIAIWIAIFGTLALYLFGKLQMPHDSPLRYLPVGRLSMGLLVLSFTIYMVPGLWGAPLKLISAFPPPLEYSESPYGVGNTRNTTAMAEGNERLPDGAHLLAPYDILSFKDYDKGLAYAKKVGKPVLLDFTGWACVNCRKMEQNVWPEPKILNILKNDVVLISLYVDDKRPLESKEIVESQLRPGKQLKYIGQKWSELQTLRYKANSQPFYVLMDHNEDNLNEPVGYVPDVEAYHQWLVKGIENF